MLLLLPILITSLSRGSHLLRWPCRFFSAQSGWWDTITVGGLLLSSSTSWILTGSPDLAWWWYFISKDWPLTYFLTNHVDKHQQRNARRWNMWRDAQLSDVCNRLSWSSTVFCSLSYYLTCIYSLAQGRWLTHVYTAVLLKCHGSLQETQFVRFLFSFCI